MTWIRPRVLRRLRLGQRVGPAVCLLVALLAAPFPRAEDWPEWRGRGRGGVWTEKGILESFPDDGLKVAWRTPVGAGYSGPAVAAGRVFVSDFRADKGLQGTERALCLDEKSGKILWTHEWPADYAPLQTTYATGPRATPTVDGDRVYVLGAVGRLFAFEAASGLVIWSRDFQRDYGTEVPTWGMTGAPLVHGRLLIALVGGADGAKVLAFDKTNGEEVWRALSSDGEPGYSPPMLVRAGGVEQLIVWHPTAVASLDPTTGKVYWEQPFDVRMGLTVATPVFDGRRLFVSAFFDGSMMLELDPDKPAARGIWRGKSKSEIETDGLHALMTTPVLDGDLVYGVCSYGQLRALEAASGRRVWESADLVGEKARWAAAFIVRHGKRYFVNTDQGDLVIAELTPDGYREIDRTELIEPTSPASHRRSRGAVHWSHPAYANTHVVVRNDREIVRAYLGQ